MTAFDLLGAKTGNSLRAAIALAESGLPFRAVTVDLRAAEHKTEQFAALNPMAKVPVLVVHEDGRSWSLAQSGAIMLEVARRAGSRLMPGGNAHAQALERLFYFLTDVIAPSHASFYLGRHKQLIGPEALDALVLDRVGASETFVSRAPFMGGEQYSLADIAAYTLIHSVQQHIEWRSRPALNEWFKRVSGRPGVKLGMKAFG